MEKQTKDQKDKEDEKMKIEIIFPAFCSAFFN